jgi:hypothetical protein
MGIVDEARIEEISADDTLLVAGPPMTGKYELMLQLLVAFSDQYIIISTKNGAERVRDDLRRVAGDLPDEYIGVIDCVSHRETMDDVKESEITKYVSSPQNMTGIGVKFTDLFGRFHDELHRGHTGVGLHSISQLLMHSDVKTVYQFLQVLIGQIRSTEWLGIAVVETAVTDDENLQLLQHHFDGIMETRENPDGRREYRIRGLTPTATDWRQF